MPASPKNNHVPPLTAAFRCAFRKITWCPISKWQDAHLWTTHFIETSTSKQQCRRMDICKYYVIEMPAVFNPSVSPFFFFKTDIFLLILEDFVHAANKFGQITPMEIDILFQLAGLHSHSGWVPVVGKRDTLLIMRGKKDPCRRLFAQETWESAKFSPHMKKMEKKVRFSDEISCLLSYVFLVFWKCVCSGVKHPWFVLK